MVPMTNTEFTKMFNAKPPQPGTYEVEIIDPTNEGSFGVIRRFANWDGVRWAPVILFEVVVGWREA